MTGMGVSEAMSACFRKALIRSGRAARAEFWWFALVFAGVHLALGAAVWIASGGTGVIRFGPGDGGRAWLLLLAVGIPLLWLTVVGVFAHARRLHDVGVSAKWLLAVLCAWALAPGALVLLGAGPGAGTVASYAGMLGWGALLAVAALPGQPRPNRWGPPPGARAPGEVFE